MSDVEKFRAFFRKADADNSGYLTKEELGKCLRKTFGDMEASQILEMFEGTDLNNDGKVTEAEFLEALGRKRSSKMSKEELSAAFKQLDKSGDGKLDQGEIRSLLEQAGKKWSDAGIQKVIRDLDKDGDGKINYKEFLALLES